MQEANNLILGKLGPPSPADALEGACKSVTDKHRFVGQALEAVEKALACNPDNIEMQRKARDLRKKMGVGAGQTKAGKENQTSQQQVTGESEGSSQTQERQSLKVVPIIKRFSVLTDPVPQDFTCSA